MRLEFPYRSERFGAVRINEVQRVVEIDSGMSRDELDRAADPVARVLSREDIAEVEQDMVVVVPCMNEPRRVIEGVLSGIPHGVLIVIVSNSDRRPSDRYDMEVHALTQFCRFAQRPALAVHQRDPGLAAAIKAAGMPELLDAEGKVRNGKGEAMLVGVALAAMSGRKYIGFIDADNFAPGSVHEYCKVYAAGLAMAESPFSMVRISWHSKPKVRGDRLFFSKRGRSSEITNGYLNRLLAEYSGFGTEAILTGNAGEHAMSLDLALRLRPAGGFAVEPYQYVDMFEQFGGVPAESDLPLLDPSPVLERNVEIFQIESRNPHFHDNKGEEHVQAMRTQALNCIYHSPLTPPGLRGEISDFLLAQEAITPGAEPPRERVYPPVATLALDRFYDGLTAEAESFHRVDIRLAHGVRTVTPLRRPH